MQWLWCWRRKSDMPMLDEQEYAEISALFRAGIAPVKEYRHKNAAPQKRVRLVEIYAPMLARYESITGFKETIPMP